MANKKRTWIQRIIAGSALAAIGFVLASPDADAATTTDTFTVSTNVVGTCTVTATDLTFPGYVSGGAAVPGSSSIDVTCTADPGNPVNPQITIADDGTGFAGFQMWGPAPGDLLNYTLAIAGTPFLYTDTYNAPSITDALTHSYAVAGTIGAAQTANLGYYSQDLVVTVTY